MPAEQNSFESRGELQVGGERLTYYRIDAV